MTTLDKFAELLEELPEDREGYEIATKLAVDTAHELQDLAVQRASHRLRGPGSPVLHELGRYARLWEDSPLGVPDKPGALTSILTLGMLGGLAGYGTGKLTGKMTGLDESRLSTTLGVLGAGVGTLPGLFNAYLNSRAGLPTWTGNILDRNHPRKRRRQHLAKYGTMIPVGTFSELIWQDPFLQPREQALATGLVSGAANMPGHRGSALVHPLDVAQMAVGMGSGALSGLLVGKTLGTIMGLSPGAQQRIQDAGVLAGLVKTIVPLAYGTR